MVYEKNILVGCTGSVAAIKLPVLIEKFQAKDVPFKVNIQVIITDHAKYFIDLRTLPTDLKVFDNTDEWKTWNKRGDPVLHIELTKWADIMLIAPLSANSLAKMANGICDNLLTCVARAWDMAKPLLFCPAMNTRMYDHPLTRSHIAHLVNWGYIEIPCISKKLMCGDTGNGAMAEVDTIIKKVIFEVNQG